MEVDDWTGPKEIAASSGGAKGCLPLRSGLWYIHNRGKGTGLDELLSQKKTRMQPGRKNALMVLPAKEVTKSKIVTS